MLRAYRPFLLLIAFALAFVAAPRDAHAQEERAAAPSSSAASIVGPSMLVLGGATLFGTSYGLTAYGGYKANVPSLYVPVVGPLIGVGQIVVEYSHANDSYSKSVIGVLGGIASAALIIDAAAQAGGVLMIIVGAKKLDATSPPSRAAWTLSPRVGPGSLGLAGTF